MTRVAGRGAAAGVLGLAVLAGGLLAAGCASGVPDPPAAIPAPAPAAVSAGGSADPLRDADASQVEELLASARSALDGQRFGRADSLYDDLWRRCGDTPTGRHALLVMAGARLDPRNPNADPAASARASARYLSLDDSEPWTRPLARQLYVLSLELGARPVDESSLRGHYAPGEDPPTGDPGPPADPEFSACSDAVDASGRTDEAPLPRLASRPVAWQLSELKARVTALEKELERIRKTLHP